MPSHPTLVRVSAPSVLAHVRGIADEAPRASPPNSSQYPVLESRALAPISRRWFRRRKRSLAELPVPVPGSVLVFQQGTRYAQVSNISQSLADPRVVDADSVSSVLLKRQALVARLQIPTSDAGTTFEVAAIFEVMVTDPALALSEGYWEVSRPLTSYLAQCPRIWLAEKRKSPSDVLEVSARLSARLTKYAQITPPHMPGFQITYVEAGVRAVLGDSESELGATNADQPATSRK